MEMDIQVKFSIERRLWVGHIQSRSLLGVVPGHPQVSARNYHPLCLVPTAFPDEDLKCASWF